MVFKTVCFYCLFFFASQKKESVEKKMENLDNLPEILNDDEDDDKPIIKGGGGGGQTIAAKPLFEDTLKKMTLKNKLISYRTNFAKYLEAYDLTLTTLNSLSMEELEMLADEIKIVIETRGSGNMLKFYYIGGVDMFERIAPVIGMNLNGLSEILKNNEAIQETLNELSIKYDVLHTQPAESRLAFLTLNAILAINNRNKQLDSITKIVEGKVAKNVVDEFSDL